MILGHIGARKGSKGVPGKNFRPLCGKPLIDWSLDQLFANPRVGAVVVSTDDEAIYDHAVKRGALEIGLRPAGTGNRHCAEMGSLAACAGRKRGADRAGFGLPRPGLHLAAAAARGCQRRADTLRNRTS